MKYAALLSLFFATGCVSSTTAYRAHFASDPEVSALRECASACDAASALGADVHACLRSCPGFAAEPGDHCAPGKEVPGTYCVTVVDRLVPDAEFWGAVASAAVDAALEERPAKEPDEPEARSASATPTTRTASRSHVRAEPKASAASTSRRASPHAERRR